MNAHMEDIFGPHEPLGCTGDDDCSSAYHIHGCYADDATNCDCPDEHTALAWGWGGRLEFTEEATRVAAAIGYQETSELRA